MNLRKLFALLMTAVMLLGMVPVGHAEGGNITPGGDITVGCNHNWDWRFPNGEPKHCQEERLMEMYCTLCGQVASSYPVTGDHTPGSWQWDGTPPANCNEWGIQNQFCSVCGEAFNEREVQGDHQWGGYVTETPAGCETPGEEVSYCSVCGEKGSSREIPPTGHDWGDWKLDVAATCNKEGLRVRYCKSCNHREEQEVPAGEHKWGGYVAETPAGCETPGEEVSYCSVCGEKGSSREIPATGHNWGDWKWEVEATCNKDGLRVRYCKNCNMREEDYVQGSKHNYGPYKTYREPTCTERGLEYMTCTRCGDENYRYIDIIDHNFGEWYVVAEAQIGLTGVEQRDCTYGCGTFEQRVIPALEQEFIPAPPSISKVVINTPANGEYFVAGESIVYRITLTNNTGMALKGVALYDPLYSTPVISPDGEGSLAIAPRLADGESISGEFSYDVTAEFALSGKVVNTAEAVYVYADDPQAMLYSAYSNTLETPVGIGDLPELHCSFGQSNVPANNEYYVPGETVRFEVEYPSLYPLVMGYVLAHVKDVPAVDVSGLATMTVLDAADVPAGESAFAYISYTVTEEDAARGAIYGYAAFTANLPNGTPVKAAITDFVTVPCGVEENSSDKLSDASLTLTMEPKYEYGPDNGTHYVLGECPWTNWKLHNNSESVTMTLDKVRYYLDGNLYKYWENEINNRVLAPGADFTDHTSWYYITEEDIARGYVTVIIETDCIGDDGKMYYATAKLELPCGPGELPDDYVPPVDDGSDELKRIRFIKSVSNTPANGEFFVPGEEIRFWLSFNILDSEGNINEEDGVYDIRFYDPLIHGQNIVRWDTNRIYSWDFHVYYTVTEEDAQRGYVENTAYVTFSYTKGGETVRVDSNTVTAPCGVGELPVDLSLTMGDPYGPANGTHYVLGEVVRPAWTVKNNSEDRVVTSLGTTYNWNDEEPFSWSTRVTLNPGRRMTTRGVTRWVTQEDVTRGYVTLNVVEVCGDGENEYTLYNSLQIPCGPGELPDDYVPPVNPDIDEDGIPNEEDPDIDGDGIPNGEDPDVDGDGIPNGEDTDVDGDGTPNGSDPDVDGDGIPNGDDPDVDGDGILNGEDDDVDGDGTPNGEDPDADGDGTPNGEDPDVDGDGTPNGEDPDVDGDGIPNGTDPDENGDGKPEDAFGVLTGMEIMKSVESLPMNGSFYTEGETVAYKITYTNSGENELINVAIYDAMSGLAEIASAEKLTPGESRTCFFNHTVTAADVARGYIANTAVGEYEVGGYSSSVNSNTVMVDTDGKEDNATVPPLFGDDDGSNYDPSTGWTDDPAAGEDGESPFGVIDTDQLRSGETHCAITITGRDNASVGYEISFCAAHAATQASALMMKQASATPEMQMQAASYAVALWRTEVESAYQKLLTAADPTAQAVLLTEYIRFVTDLDNYEAILNALYPDQPALVAGKIADMWQDKCVALCHEMHTLAADRKDSLLSVEAASGAVANVCGCDITLEENGKKAFTQTYCPVHGFPYSMMDMLLGGKDTAETWAMVRQIWGVELTNAYSKVAVKLGDNGAAAKAGYAVMTQWMMAREASLIALYPENPELVAQTMVKLIMDRVNNLCLTGK